MKSLHIDWINCGLIVIAAVIAGMTPFALLVLAYVLLGPLHYLTEILWLDERGYFLPRHRDVRWLSIITAIGLIAGLMVGWLSSAVDGQSSLAAVAYHLQQLAITAALAALVTPLVLWHFPGSWQRLLALAFVAILGAVFYYGWDAYSYYLLFAVLLPTLIHVVAFTGIFMLNGALKARSVPGLVAVVMLFICSTFLLLADLPAWSLNESTFLESYRQTLGFVNEGLMTWLTPSERPEDAVLSPLGLRITRFLAFAYTYHYLNWFSKTTVIGWHRLKSFPLFKIVGLWSICVGLYCCDYSLGLTVVGMLSLLHVVYEFPLNWLSILGLTHEARTIVFSGWRTQLVANR